MNSDHHIWSDVPQDAIDVFGSDGLIEIVEQKIDGGPRQRWLRLRKFERGIR